MSLDTMNHFCPASWLKLLKYLRRLEGRIKYIEKRSYEITEGTETIQNVDWYARERIDELNWRTTFLEDYFAEIEAETKVILRKNLEKAKYPEHEIERILKARDKKES